MKLAIIIPAKNEEEVLPLLFESIAAQSEQPDEVVLVDSHSTDATVARAGAFKNKLPLRVVTAQQKGVTHARNEGAATATADYLLFVDADLTLPPDFVEKTKQDILAHALDHGTFRQVMPSNQFGIRFGAQMMNGYARVMGRTPWPIAFSCFFMSRKLHEKIGGLDPEIFVMEDYDYVLRGRRAGGRFGIIKGTFFYASPRRYEAENGGKSIIQGAYAEVYRYTHGMRVTKPLFTYDMGGKKDDKS